MSGSRLGGVGLGGIGFAGHRFGDTGRFSAGRFRRRAGARGRPGARPESHPWRLPGAIAALAWALAGCTGAPLPDPALPGVELPAEWTAETGQDPGSFADAGAIDAEPWYRLYADPDTGSPQLVALIEEALAANLDLAAAAARVEAAAAQARIAGAERLPQLSAGANAARQRQNFIGLPIPGAEQRVLSSTATTLGVSLDLSWEADLWGRIRAAVDAAGADYEAARADYAAARLSLSGQAAKVWLALADAEAQRGLARRTLENRESTAGRLMRRYEAGLVGPLDVRLAESSRALAEAALAARQRQVDALRRQLEVLLGRYPAGRVEAAAEQLPDRLPTVPAGLPAELLERRPDLQAAERRLVAAAARVAEARSARLPRLSLTASGGRRSQELEDLLDGDFTIWSLAGGLVAPLFQGGRLAAAADLAVSGYEAEIARWAQQALAAFAEVESALVAEQTLAAEVEALAAATEQSRAALRLADERYGSGLVGYLSVLASQQQAFEAESRLLDARRRRLEARVDLHLALGGGFAPPAGEAPPLSDPPAAAAGSR